MVTYAIIDALLWGGFLLSFGLIAVYIERKVAAFIQDRLGPYEVGPKGILQTIADIFKLLQKETILPQNSDKLAFTIAPFATFIFVFCTFAWFTTKPWFFEDLGLLFIFTFLALEAFFIVIAGLSSASHYAYLGAFRALSQILAYELPLITILLAIIFLFKTLSLSTIAQMQKQWGNYNGFLAWNILRYPYLIPAFVLFLLLGLAESNRAPFDLPESESELVAGFLTEYSGIRFAFFFLAEYAKMLLFALLSVWLFLGAYHSPLPDWTTTALTIPWQQFAALQWHQLTTGPYWNAFWLALKTTLVFFIQLWLRWSLPRLRPDQVIHYAWKWAFPIALAILFVSLLTT